LEVLEIDQFHSETPGKHLDTCVKHITALPRLRVLSIEPRIEHTNFQITGDEWKRMEKLESLEIKYNIGEFSRTLIRCCPKLLTNIRVENIDDKDLQYMMKNLPSLTSVGLDYCRLSNKYFSAFLKQFAPQLVPLFRSRYRN